MNDSPVDCQNREWTEPQREGGTAIAVTEEVSTNTGGYGIRPYDTNQSSIEPVGEGLCPLPR